jgi:hypothetical protein
VCGGGVRVGCVFITAGPVGGGGRAFYYTVCVFITAVPNTKLFAWGVCVYYCAPTYTVYTVSRDSVCVLLLQDLLQSCARGGRRRVEDMCYERRRAEACVDESAHLGPVRNPVL